MVGKFNDQDAVFCGHTHQHQQPHLPVNIEGQAPGCQAQPGPQEGQGHRDQDHKGIKEAVVQGGQHQHHHHDGQAKNPQVAATGLGFFAGQACPTDLGAAVAHLSLHLLEPGYGLATAHPWLGDRPNADGSYQAAVVDRGGATAPFHLHQFGQGDQQAIAVFDGEIEHIGRIAPAGPIELHDHLAHLAALEAVVDVIRTKARAQGVDHRAEIHPQGGHLQPVGHQLNLGGPGGEAGGDPLKLTGGRGGPNEGAGFGLKAFEIQLAIAGVE